MTTYTGNYSKTYTVTITNTFKKPPVYVTNPRATKFYSKNSFSHAYTEIAGLRVHKSLLTPHTKSLFQGYDNTGDFIFCLNLLMQEENIELNPHLDDYKSLLKSLLIIDSYFVWELFQENVPADEQSYLFWVQLAEDSNWDICKKALKQMPGFFMMRFLLKYADESIPVIRNERLKVICKRKDNYGSTPELLLQTVQTLNKLSQNSNI